MVVPTTIVRDGGAVLTGSCRMISGPFRRLFKRGRVQQRLRCVQ